MKLYIIKRLAVDPLVIGFMLVGCIILLYVFFSLPSDPSITGHGDINFSAKRPFLCFALKSSIVALQFAVHTDRNFAEKGIFPMRIYVIMFLIQALFYFLLGSIISLSSKDNFVRTTIIFGLLILGLVWAFNINPVEGSVVYKPIQGSILFYLLLISSLPNWTVAIIFVSRFGLGSIAMILAMLLTQVVIFWVIGNLFKPVLIGIYESSRIIFTKKG